MHEWHSETANLSQKYGTVSDRDRASQASKARKHNSLGRGGGGGVSVVGKPIHLLRDRRRGFRLAKRVVYCTKSRSLEVSKSISLFSCREKAVQSRLTWAVQCSAVQQVLKPPLRLCENSPGLLFLLQLQRGKKKERKEKKKKEKKKKVNEKKRNLSC